jgi:molecular chaperone GrpE
MSKHSFHHEHHHNNRREKGKDPVKPGENPAAGDSESGTAPSGAGQEEIRNAGTEGGEDPRAADAGETGGAAAVPEQDDPGNNGDPGAEGRIAELEARLEESRDQLLRKAADFENFRKRVNREKLEAIEFANQSLLLDLIPILDDFDRAVQSAENSQDFAALYEGVGMIAKRLAGVLDSKWGLKSYISAGTPFDPNFHEALMMEKSSAVAEQTVQTDLLKGYTLKNRVIRSAKVKVLDPDPAAPAIEAPPPPGKEEGEGGPESPAGGLDQETEHA